MRQRRPYFVYIMTNRRRTVLYTGVTGNLVRRLAQHRNNRGGRFTRRYQAHLLVWFEVHESPWSATAREKQIKAGPRWRKVALIERLNPTWKDLSGGL